MGPAQTPDGESFMPLLQGRPWTRAQPIAWAHEAGVQDWKLLVPRLLAAWRMDDVHG